MDITSIWVFLQRLQRQGSTVILVVLAFAAGWQVHEYVSQQETTHPILFQEPPAVEQGSVQAATDDSDNDTVPTPPQVSDIDNSQRFVASVNSDLYHDPSCSAAKRILPENQVWFTSIQEAEDAGYTASKCTRDIIEK